MGMQGRTINNVSEPFVAVMEIVANLSLSHRQRSVGLRLVCVVDALLVQ